MKCESKRHYGSRAAAEKAATRTHVAAAKGRGWLYPYQCAQCGLWHLTHFTPAEQAKRSAAVARQRELDARKITATPKAEPPTTKALRTKLTEISCALKLDERRQDAARIKRAEAIGKLVAADVARAKAEDDYRAAQADVLRLLGVN